MYKVVRLSKKKYFVEKAPRHIFLLGNIFKYIFVKLCILQLKYPFLSPFYRWFAHYVYYKINNFVKSRTQIYIGENVGSRMKMFLIKKDWK